MPLLVGNCVDIVFDKVLITLPIDGPHLRTLQPRPSLRTDSFLNQSSLLDSNIPNLVVLETQSGRYLNRHVFFRDVVEVFLLLKLLQPRLWIVQLCSPRDFIWNLALEVVQAVDCFESTSSDWFPRLVQVVIDLAVELNISHFLGQAWLQIVQRLGKQVALNSFLHPWQLPPWFGSGS